MMSAWTPAAKVPSAKETAMVKGLIVRFIVVLGFQLGMSREPPGGPAAYYNTNARRNKNMAIA